MIGYITGKILYTDGNTVGLLTESGIGFEIECSGQALAGLIGKETGSVYTYLAVRENETSLYGFASRKEKATFLELVSVSGVGPKIAMAVLSNMTLADFAMAVASQDVKTLSKVKGLGKKTAERIILELREKVTAVADEDSVVISVPQKDESEYAENAVIALMSLGLTRAECKPLLKAAVENGCKTVEEQVSFAVRSLR